MVEDVLERQERELRVVGGESDAAVVGVAAREVVADRTVLRSSLQGRYDARRNKSKRSAKNSRFGFNSSERGT